MARIASYRDLVVWQKAMDLAICCYEVTAFPAQERFGLAAQLRKAAVSIPSNVAEGHNRRSRDAYRNHVSIALGSQAEVETQMELARRLQFVGTPEASRLGKLAAEVGRLLHGLVRALEHDDLRR